MAVLCPVRLPAERVERASQARKCPAAVRGAQLLHLLQAEFLELQESYDKRKLALGVGGRGNEIIDPVLTPSILRFLSLPCASGVLGAVCALVCGAAGTLQRRAFDLIVPYCE
jgi:hypothetical protein